MILLTVGIQTPVKIHLTTKVKIDSEEEIYELTLFGKYYRKGEAIYLKYDEVQEEGTIHTVVKIKHEEVVILRSGIMKMRLSFRLAESRDGTHESTFGNLFLSTNTKGLSHREESEGVGSLKLAYDLSMQGTLAGYYEMEINYKEDMHQL